MGGDGQHVPGSVREPLLLTAPVVVGARLLVGQYPVDVVLVVETAGDSIGYSTRSGG